MEILIITPTFFPAVTYGGPILSELSLVKNLAKDGDVGLTVYTTDNLKGNSRINPDDFLELNGVEIKYFRSNIGEPYHLSLRLMYELCKNHKGFDRVHIMGFWNITALFGLFFGWIHGKKLYFTPRGMLSNYSLSKHPVRKIVAIMFIKLTMRNNVTVHATSDHEVRQVNLMGCDRTVKIPNMIRLSESRACHFEDGALRLVFASRIHEKKGLAEFIRKIAGHEGWTLDIYGIGGADYIESIEAVINEYNLDGRVRWMGWSDSKKYLRNSYYDYHILPSRDENFANIVFEFLSYGIPSLLTKEVGCSEWIIRHRLGLVLEMEYLESDENFQDLKEQRRIITNGFNARFKDLRKEFSSANLLREYKSMYEF